MLEMTRNTNATGHIDLNNGIDTCGLNDTAYIIEYTNHVVEKPPFSDS
jgi:hypothetical protein